MKVDIKVLKRFLLILIISTTSLLASGDTKNIKSNSKKITTDDKALQKFKDENDKKIISLKNNPTQQDLKNQKQNPKKTEVEEVTQSPSKTLIELKNKKTKLTPEEKKLFNNLQESVDNGYSVQNQKNILNQKGHAYIMLGDGRPVFAPTPLSFGNVYLNKKSQIAVTVTKLGNDTLKVSSMYETSKLGGINAYTANFSNPFNIATGGTATIYVDFSPSVAGNDTGYVYLVHNGVGGLDSFRVVGVGVTPAFNPSVFSMDFGTKTINTSKVDSVYIKNKSGTDLTISSTTSTGNVFVHNFTTSTTIAAQDSKFVRITFTPTAVTSYNNYIIFTHNGGTTPDTIAVSGIGETATLALNLRTVTIPTTVRNYLITDRTIVLNNTSLATILTIASITSNKASITATLDSSTIRSGEYHQLKINFLPSLAGIDTAKIIIDHNGASDKDTVVVIAEAINNEFSSNRRNVDFGSIANNTTKRDSVTITNTKTGAGDSLRISQIVIFNNLFSIDPLTAVIAPSGTRKFYITYNPINLKDSSEIIFYHNGILRSDTVTVKGQRVDGVFAKSKLLIDFPPVRIGKQKLDSVVISNTSTVTPLVISSVGATGIQFLVSPSSATIQPSSSQKFYVTFSPTFRGDVYSNLIFNHNGSSLSDTVSIHGISEYPEPYFVRRNIAYGTVHINNSIAETLIVKNNSIYEPLIITSVTSDNSAFILTPLASTLDTMASERFIIEFLPTELKNYSANIIFKHDSRKTADTVTLTGTGSAGVFSASNNNVQLGSVSVNFIKRDSILITNTSNNVSLKISSIVSTSQYFHVNPPNAILNPLGAQKFEVSFNAMQAGVNTAQLYFYHDGKSLIDTVNVSATTELPKLSVQSTLSFGTINANSNNSKIVKLINTSIAKLTINKIEKGKIDISFATQLPIIISPAETLTFKIDLKPNFAGAFSFPFIFYHDGAKQSDTIIISGTSAVPLLTSPYMNGFDELNLKTIPEGWIGIDHSNSGQTFLTQSNLYYLPGNNTKYIAVDSDSLRGKSKQIKTTLLSPVINITNVNYAVWISYTEYFATTGTSIGKVKAVFDNDTVLVKTHNKQTAGWVVNKMNLIKPTGKNNFRLIFEYDDFGKTNLGWGIDNLTIIGDIADTVAPVVQSIPIDNYTMKKTGISLSANVIEDRAIDSVFIRWKTRENSTDAFIEQPSLLMTTSPASQTNIWNATLNIPSDPNKLEIEYYTEAKDRAGNRSYSNKNILNYFKHGEKLPWVETFDGITHSTLNYHGFKIIKYFGVNNTNALAFNAFGKDTSAKISSKFINLQIDTTRDLVLKFRFNSIKFSNFEHYNFMGDSVIVKLSIDEREPVKIYKIDSTSRLNKNDFDTLEVPIKNYLPPVANSMRVFFECYADKNAINSNQNYLMLFDNLFITATNTDLEHPVITGNFNYFATTKSDSIKIEARASDNIGVRQVGLFYSKDTTIIHKVMLPIGGGNYRAYIPGFPQGTGVTYTVFVVDSGWNVTHSPISSYDIVNHKTPPYLSSQRQLPLYLYSGEGGGDNLQYGNYTNGHVGFYEWGNVNAVDKYFDIATSYFLPIANRSTFSFKYSLLTDDSLDNVTPYKMGAGDSIFVYAIANENQKVILETITSVNHLELLKNRRKTYDVSQFKNDSLQFHIAAKITNPQNYFTIEFDSLQFKNFDANAKPIARFIDSTLNLNVASGKTKTGTVRITNEGLGYLNYSATLSPSYSWLTINNPIDSLLTGKIQSLNLIANSLGIANGVYLSTLKISTNDVAKPLIQIPVSIVINDAFNLIVYSSANGAYTLPARTHEGVIWGSNGYGDKAKAVYVPVTELEYEISNIKIAFAKWHTSFAYSLEVYSGNTTTGPQTLLHRQSFSLDRIKEQQKMVDSAKYLFNIDSAQFTDHYLSSSVLVNQGCFVVVRFDEITNSPGAISILHNQESIGNNSWELSNVNKWGKMSSPNSWGKDYLPIMVVSSRTPRFLTTIQEVTSVNLHDSLKLTITISNPDSCIAKNFSLTFQFPDTLLRYVRADISNSTLSGMSLKTDLLNNNRIRLSGTVNEPYKLATGTLVKLVFTAHTSGEKPITLLNFSINNNLQYSLINSGVVKVKPLTFTKDEKLIPKEFALYQNYPNPFNPSTEVKFDLPKQSKVQIYVYDLLGRLVSKLVDKELTAGQHTVNWNSTSHNSGIYFLIMNAENFKQTKKMILIK